MIIVAIVAILIFLFFSIFVDILKVLLYFARVIVESALLVLLWIATFGALILVKIGGLIGAVLTKSRQHREYNGHPSGPAISHPETVLESKLN